MTCCVDRDPGCSFFPELPFHLIWVLSESVPSGLKFLPLGFIFAVPWEGLSLSLSPHRPWTLNTLLFHP